MGFTKGQPVYSHMPTIEELKKAPRELHIPTYNYCGPKTQYALRKSGKYQEMMKKAGKKPIGTKPYGNPKNSLDRACFEHDSAYSSDDRTIESIRKADIKLQNEASKIAKKSKNILEKGSAFVVSKTMSGKKILEDLGVMKEGSFADIKKAETGGIILRRNYII